MFRAVENKGFQLSFANGLTFSCMFGSINYCNNRHNTKADGTCPNAEFAVFPTARFLEDGSEDVSYVFADGGAGTGYVGWCSPEKIAKAMALVAAHPKDGDTATLVAALKQLDD